LQVVAVAVDPGAQAISPAATRTDEVAAPATTGGIKPETNSVIPATASGMFSTRNLRRLIVNPRTQRLEIDRTGPEALG
jgi:hypothetical protein